MISTSYTAQVHPHAPSSSESNATIRPLQRHGHGYPYHSCHEWGSHEPVQKASCCGCRGLLHSMKHELEATRRDSSSKIEILRLHSKSECLQPESLSQLRPVSEGWAGHSSTEHEVNSGWPNSVQSTKECDACRIYKKNWSPDMKNPVPCRLHQFFCRPFSAPS